ncbi:MAG: trigger factor, partial [Ferruginibacter sp.]
FTLDETFEGDKLDMMLQDLGFEKGDAAAAKKMFELDIIKIGLVTKRDLTEDFFNEVFPGKGVTNEDEFKVALKAELEQYWEAQSRNQLHDQLYHFLLDDTKMEFPETFLKRWLQTGGENPKTAEEAENEFPGFSSQLKWTLISDKITNDNKLEVSEEELRENMRAEVMRYFGQMGMGEDTSWLESYLDRMMKDEKQVDATYRRLSAEKLFGWAAGAVKPVEKTTTPEALTGMMHHHQH